MFDGSTKNFKRNVLALLLLATTYYELNWCMKYQSCGTLALADTKDESLPVFITDFEELAHCFTGRRILQKTKAFYFIIPSRKQLTLEEQSVYLSPNHTIFDRLISVLLEHPFVQAVAGSSGNVPKPVCTLQIAGRTVFQYHNYSKLWNNDSSIEISRHNLKCYACDLLSDSFLVRGQAIVAYFYKNRHAYSIMGEGMHLSLFLHLQQHSVYCPHINITTASATQRRYTCNNLGSRWDQKFSGFFQHHGIYRIVPPDGRHVWLTCVWSASSVHQKLPIACYNFLYQYLLDMTETLQNRFNISYRLNFGTVLGAARNQNIIPWTPDIDITVNVSFADEPLFRALWREKLPLLSNWLFSPVSTKGSDHLSPTKRLLRAYPRCPVIINATVNEDMENKIGQELFNRKNIHSNIWDHTSAGNVDIYFQKFEFCDIQTSFSSPPDWVTIRERNFSAVSHSNEMLECSYGKDYLTKLPRGVGNFGDSVSSHT